MTAKTILYEDIVRLRNDVGAMLSQFTKNAPPIVVGPSKNLLESLAPRLAYRHQPYRFNECDLLSYALEIGGSMPALPPLYSESALSLLLEFFAFKSKVQLRPSNGSYYESALRLHEVERKLAFNMLDDTRFLNRLRFNPSPYNNLVLDAFDAIKAFRDAVYGRIIEHRALADLTVAHAKASAQAVARAHPTIMVISPTDLSLLTHYWLERYIEAGGEVYAIATSDIPLFDFVWSSGKIIEPLERVRSSSLHVTRANEFADHLKAKFNGARPSGRKVTLPGLRLYPETQFSRWVDHVHFGVDLIKELLDRGSQPQDVACIVPSLNVMFYEEIVRYGESVGVRFFSPFRFRSSLQSPSHQAVVVMCVDKQAFHLANVNYDALFRDAWFTLLPDTPPRALDAIYGKNKVGDGYIEEEGPWPDWLRQEINAFFAAKQSWLHSRQPLSERIASLVDWAKNRPHWIFHKSEAYIQQMRSLIRFIRNLEQVVGNMIGYDDHGLFESVLLAEMLNGVFIMEEPHDHQQRKSMVLLSTPHAYLSNGFFHKHHVWLDITNHTWTFTPFQRLYIPDISFDPRDGDLSATWKHTPLFNRSSVRFEIIRSLVARCEVSLQSVASPYDINQGAQNYLLAESFEDLQYVPALQPSVQPHALHSSTSRAFLSA